MLLISFICFLLNIFYIFEKHTSFVGIFTIFPVLLLPGFLYLASFSNATCSLIIFPVVCGLLILCVAPFILKCSIRDTSILLNTSPSEHYYCMLKCILCHGCVIAIVPSTYKTELRVKAFLNPPAFGVYTSFSPPCDLVLQPSQHLPSMHLEEIEGHFVNGFSIFSSWCSKMFDMHQSPLLLPPKLKGQEERLQVILWDLMLKSNAIWQNYLAFNKLWEMLQWLSCYWYLLTSGM